MTMYTGSTYTMLQAYVGAAWYRVTSWIPPASPLHSDALFYGFWASLAIQHTIFHILSHTIFSGNSTAQLKKRCWVLTTLNGFVTTSASIPFLWDLFSNGFDMHAIKLRPKYTHIFSGFFVAYLLSDLGLGSIYYRKLINFSSGWAHHTVYTFLFLFWVHKGWDHIAIMACVFELPTFIMGIASLHPPLRSNVAFTSTFFLTRVFFHIALLCSIVTPHGRSAPGIDGSWGPSISVIVTLPMHLWWGYKCYLSVRRRMHKRKLAARAEREKQGSYFTNIAGQAFNGFQAPDVSSAVNTPTITPSPSPMLSATNFVSSGPAAIQNAFAKAAAASKRPMQLVMRRKRSDASIASTSGIDDIPALDDGALSESMLTVPKRPSNSRRSSGEAVRGVTKKLVSAPLTVPVRPDGATADSREPFLAIRSEAEGTDRARRLVADAVRKLWNGAPESWRLQFEEEARLMDVRKKKAAQKQNGVNGHGIGIGHTNGSNGSSSAVVSTEHSQTQEDGDGEQMLRRRTRRDDDAEGDTSLTTEEEAEALSDAIASDDRRSRAQRARAMLRRGVLRAVRRAINGKSVSASRSLLEGEEGLTLPSNRTSDDIGSGSRNDESYSETEAEEEYANAQALDEGGEAETARVLENLDLNTVLKLSGLHVPIEDGGHATT